jgi:hypothetical protein
MLALLDTYQLGALHAELAIVASRDMNGDGVLARVQNCNTRKAGEIGVA